MGEDKTLHETIQPIQDIYYSWLINKVMPVIKNIIRALTKVIKKLAS